jgi:hypothetical protein
MTKGVGRAPTANGQGTKAVRRGIDEWLAGTQVESGFGRRLFVQDGVTGYEKHF